MKLPFFSASHGARTLVRILLCALAILLLFLVRWNADRSTPLAPVLSIGPVIHITPPAGGVATRALPAEGLSPEPSHPLAVSFGADPILAQREAGILLEILTFYRKEFGSFPAGQENADIMNALTGNNPRRLPIFPRKHPRMDASGNLLDAWGKPFVFHPISSQHLEVMSCGPDGEIFTADDIRVPPPR